MNVVAQNKLLLPVMQLVVGVDARVKAALVMEREVPGNVALWEKEEFGVNVAMAEVVVVLEVVSLFAVVVV